MITVEELRAARDADLAERLAAIERTIDTGITAANRSGATSWNYQTLAITQAQAVQLGGLYKNNGFGVTVAPAVINSQTAVLMTFTWP